MFDFEDVRVDLAPWLADHGLELWAPPHVVLAPLVAAKHRLDGPFPPVPSARAQLAVLDSQERALLDQRAFYGGRLRLLTLQLEPLEARCAALAPLIGRGAAHRLAPAPVKRAELAALEAQVLGLRQEVAKLKNELRVAEAALAHMPEARRSVGTDDVVSLTVHSYMFMWRKGTKEPVTEVPPAFRGNRDLLVRDPDGRYHQQLREFVDSVPLNVFLASGMKEGTVYWNHEHASIEYEPAIPWSARLFASGPLHEFASLDMHKSAMTALRISEARVLPPDEGYDALAVANYASGRNVAVYNKYMTAQGGRGAPMDVWLGLPPRPTAASKQQPQQQPPRGPVQGGLDGWLVPAASSAASAGPMQLDHGREDLLATNACCYDIVISTYKRRFDDLQRPNPQAKDHKGGRKKDVDMSIEGLHAVFKPGAAFDPSNLGLTLLEFRRFFEKHGLTLVVLDIAGQRIEEACYKPEWRNKKLWPSTVWVLQHNGHLYQLNSRLKAAEQLLLVKTRPWRAPRPWRSRPLLPTAMR